MYSRESNNNCKKTQHIDDSHQQELWSYKLAQLKKNGDHCNNQLSPH